jgi:hypothetical protein
VGRIDFWEGKRPDIGPPCFCSIYLTVSHASLMARVDHLRNVRSPVGIESFPTHANALFCEVPGPTEQISSEMQVTC